jgi:hypothetical protein
MIEMITSVVGPHSFVVTAFKEIVQNLGNVATGVSAEVTQSGEGRKHENEISGICMKVSLINRAQERNN